MFDSNAGMLIVQARPHMKPSYCTHPPSVFRSILTPTASVSAVIPNIYVGPFENCLLDLGRLAI